MTIVFICLLVTLLTPRKKSDPTPTLELEAQIKEKVQDAVGKALVENKIEKNTTVSLTASVSAPTKKVFDPYVVNQKRSHAKFTLSNMYLALSSFHAEHGRYTSDLTLGDFKLTEGVQASKTGFINVFLIDENSRISGMSENDESPYRNNSDYFVISKYQQQKIQPFYTKEAEQIDFKDYEKFCKNKCSADENSFEIISIIPFDEDHVDVWIMNERKELIQVQDGLQGM